MVFPPIADVLNALDLDTIPGERKELLKPFSQAINAKQETKQAILLNFICTHNSRRSVLSQIWAQAIASHLDILNVHSYSGGTETTAIYPSILSTLEGQGFRITAINDGRNPHTSISYSPEEPPIIGFSKRYDDSFNPKSAFFAVMTCSEADKGCPYLPQAEKRFALPFEDPKVSDGTSKEAEAYKARSLQIATELMYVFSNLNQ
jgi:arsenate reductase